MTRYYPNDVSPTVLLTTTESQPVSYSIEIPGIGYYHNGTVSTNNDVIVYLPKSIVVSSHDDQDKGIYLKTSNGEVTVVSQSVLRGSIDTFLALPTESLCFKEFVYYGMSMRKTITFTSTYNSSVLIVGSENNTMMKLTVTQPVTIKVDDTDTNLISGRQYSFVINRLQTVYVRSLEDLTGTKIVTNKPVSVFSGHQCGNVPFYADACDHLTEQVPPTILWGKVHYTAPLATRSSCTIKVLAAYDSTNVDFYCNNTRRSYTINEGEYLSRELGYKEYCVIRSNKEVLTAQLSHGQVYDYVRGNNAEGDPMMTLVPATIHYSNEFSSTTLRDPPQRGYKHYINIIVLAHYYQPDMIYLITRGMNKSLDTQEWVPVKANNIIEAYATTVNATEGLVEVIHSNTSALMTTVHYGFASYTSYGHPGGLSTHAGMCIVVYSMSTRS